jgi:hypothetical protein
MKGLKPNKTNIRMCTFRKELLKFCKEFFEQLLEAPLNEKKKENETDEALLERELKT